MFRSLKPPVSENIATFCWKHSIVGTCYEERCLCRLLWIFPPHSDHRQTSLTCLPFLLCAGEARNCRLDTVPTPLCSEQTSSDLSMCHVSRLSSRGHDSCEYRSWLRILTTILLRPYVMVSKWKDNFLNLLSFSRKWVIVNEAPRLPRQFGPLRSSSASCAAS